MKEAFESYLRHELCRAPLTVEAYIHDLEEFAEYITAGKPDAFDAVTVTRNDVRTWLGYLGRNHSPRTLRRKTQSLRAFFRFLMKRRLITSNPAAEVTLAKTAKPLPEFVRDDELESLLQGLQESDDPADRRDRLILLLLYATGMRRAELCSLRLQDVDTRQGQARITGKRDKQRVVPLAGALCREIDDYLTTLRGNPDHDILIDIDGEPLTPWRLYRIVKARLGETSAQKKSPHVLRHTFATSMLNHGAGMESVKEFLGHESLATTQVYTHVSFAELRKAYTGAHPRSKK